MIETIFEHPEFDRHEQVVFCHDAASGLHAIIALHDTYLGPALGGTRVWTYASPAEAVTDVLRLSRGMTYKNALAGLDSGGGKAVILLPSRDAKTAAMIEAFGRYVGTLGGRYVTAKDVGITSADLELILAQTPHVAGVGPNGAGDPSPHTAVGIVAGIRAALAHVFGSPDPTGRHVAIQGVGAVGLGVATLLKQAGARLTISDIHDHHVVRAVEAVGADVVGSDAVHRVEADVFSPCALGAVLNEASIPELGAPIVAGGANNQLATPEDGRRLAERGILYAPDYAINAGGVISLSFPAGAEPAAINARLKGIGDTLSEIFRRAEADGATTADVADRMAEERFRPA